MERFNDAWKFETMNTKRAEEIMDRLNEDYIKFKLSYRLADNGKKIWSFLLMPYPMQVSRTLQIVEQSA